MKRLYLITGLVLGIAISLGNIANAAFAPLSPPAGGTGTSTPPTYGNILVGNSSGTYTLTATSSLGIVGAASSPGGSSGQVQYNGSGSFAGVATSTVTAGSGVSFTGTPGYLIGGTNLTINATGGGSGVGTVSTSTTPAIGQLSYWTSAGYPSLLGSVATGTVSGAGNISVTAGRSVVGGALSIDGSSLVPYTGATGSVTLGANSLTTTGLTISDTLNSLLLADGSGIVGTYGGVTCASMFMRSLSSTGIGGCEAVILTSDIAGILPIANGGTNSSSFATNGVAYFDGSSIIADSILTTTGGKFGIGSTTPWAFLSVRATNDNEPLVAISGTSMSSTSFTILGVNNGGNVGIGTTTPGTLLSLGNTGNDTINISATATSTFGSGINLRSGCFSIAGVCVGAGGGSGTVTSVDMTVPTGLSISGNPITTSGTLALSLAGGYNIPLTASTTNWNTFYDTPSNRITAGTNLSWSGNTLNASAGSGTGLSTTTPISGSNVLVYSAAGAGAAYGAATTTLTASGVLTLSQPISVLGSSASALTLTGGSAGQVLGWLGGVPTWTASTSASAGTGISISNSGAVHTITNTGVISGSCTWPQVCSGTNPLAITWGGLATSSAISAASGLLYATGVKTFASIATSTLSVGASITSSGTLGYQVGGTASSLSLNMANANTWTALQTFGGLSATNATTTGTMAIPVGASVITPVAGNMAIDTTSGQLRYSDVTGTVRVISPVRDLGFAYATTTWSGTTTLRIGPAPGNITVSSVYCETNTGTVGVSLYDGTNRANYIPTASTTINKNTYNTNNTFTAGETIRVDLGTPATSPTNLSCRFLYTYDAD